MFGRLRERSEARSVYALTQKPRATSLNAEMYVAARHYVFTARKIVKKVPKIIRK